MKKQTVLLVALFLSLASLTPHSHSAGCGSCCSPCYDTCCGPCDSSCCSRSCCGCTEDKAVTPNKIFTGKLTYKNNTLSIYKKRNRYFTLFETVDFRFSKCSKYLFVERLISRDSCATTFSIYNLNTKKKILDAPQNAIFDYEDCRDGIGELTIRHCSITCEVNLDIKFFEPSNLTIKIIPDCYDLSKKLKSHSFTNTWKAVLDESNKNLIIYFRTGHVKIYKFNSYTSSKPLYEFV